MLLQKQMDRLAAFQPTELPVISLYLDARSGEHGRDNFGAFVRKALKERQRTFPLRSPERVSFDEDVARINHYLSEELHPSANGVAIFACKGADDFFVDLQLDAPIEEHKLYIYNQPHLYPLARLADQFPRYAAVVADTNSARIFIFGLGTTFDKESVESTKVSRTQMGGWSQMRYQRHTDNYRLHHAKELVETLDRVVREEAIKHIVLAGDEVIIPLIQEQLSKHLSDKVIDVLRLDISTPEHEILRHTMESLREHNIQTDAERVRHLLDEYRSGGLAVIGAHDTMAALANGQADEVLISATLEQLHAGAEEFGAPLSGGAPPVADDEMNATRAIKIADELVTQSHQTGARVTFIEDSALLADIGGVGALLRYRI